MMADEPKTQSSGQTLKKVMDYIEENQEKQRETYVMRTAEELKMDIDTIYKSFDFLEFELEIAKSERKGNKRLIKLTVDRHPEERDKESVSSSGKTLKELLDSIEQNQDEYEGYKENYVSNIADELGLSKPTVISAFNFLEDEMGIAKTWKEGNKRYIELRVNRGHE